MCSFIAVIFELIRPCNLNIEDFSQIDFLALWVCDDTHGNKMPAYNDLTLYTLS